MDPRTEGAMTGRGRDREPLDFRTRWAGAERMDDPACDESALCRTVDQFASLNRLVSRYRSILSRWVLDDMRTTDVGRVWHLADLGAGGCDIPVWLLREARRRGLRLTVTAIDADPRIVRHARRIQGHELDLDIRFGNLIDIDALGPVDYLFANHVLHHLPDEAIPAVLARMHAAARRRWVVSDLSRSRWAYVGFHILGPLYRDSFALEDGLRSIRRGFTIPELTAHLHAAGLAGKASLHRLVPARLCLMGGS
jgi:2-polyprenyl-3-methyl-5-hydroxy-6-metoxy-1,4-benzoquinol methylase